MRYLWTMLGLWACGCGGGPLALPYVERLGPDQQRVVDQSWLNMLSPPERLDRSRLLDVVVEQWLHQQGVDRLQFTSEKDVWGGRIIMTVYYDRSHPAFDSFAIAFVDAQGCERRRERYTFDEVKRHARELAVPMEGPSTRPATLPAEVEEQRRAEQAMADRLARKILVKVATRPAGEPVHESEVISP